MESIKESLKPFKMSGTAAITTVSKNRRNYTPEFLAQLAPTYVGKPLLFDHAEHDSAAVTGIITGAKFDGARLKYEAVGLMDADLFDKMAGKKFKDADIPPLIKNVSISADVEATSEDEEGNIMPLRGEGREISITPFPGIPEAQVEELIEIRESLVNKRDSEELEDTEESFGDASFPDSSFAYVPPEAKGKDGNKSARKLPYKTASGKVDLPHLRNALARFNQTDLPASAKAGVTAKLCAAAKAAGIDSEFCKGESDNAPEENENEVNKQMKDEKEAPKETATTQSIKEVVAASAPAATTAVTVNTDELKATIDALRKEVEAMKAEKVKVEEPKAEPKGVAGPAAMESEPKFESAHDMVEFYKQLKKDGLNDKQAWRFTAFRVLKSKDKS